MSRGVASLSELSVLCDYFGCGRESWESKEWAQTGTGSWSESCNHVWWLIVGSGKCQREGSHRVGHICLIRFALAAAVTGFSFHMYDLQVLIMDPLVAILKVLSSLATMWTAGWVCTHAISGGRSYLQSLILQQNNYCSLERSWITPQLETYSLDKAS